jgi:hypothetical protein
MGRSQSIENEDYFRLKNEVSFVDAFAGVDFELVFVAGVVVVATLVVTAGLDFDGVDAVAEEEAFCRSKFNAASTFC